MDEVDGKLSGKDHWRNSGNREGIVAVECTVECSFHDIDHSNTKKTRKDLNDRNQCSASQNQQTRKTFILVITRAPGASEHPCLPSNPTIKRIRPQPTTTLSSLIPKNSLAFPSILRYRLFPSSLPSFLSFHWLAEGEVS